MPRRPTTKSSRAVRASTAPTPVQSLQATPTSSAYPSTYASEVEVDADDQVAKLPIGALSLRDGSPAPEVVLKKPKPQPRIPFRFLDLPSELRIKIYQYHFCEVSEVVDLDPDNHKRIHKKLALMRTCRTIYHEASHLFYSTTRFRIFPTTWGKPFKTKRPLLARMNTRQRSCFTSLELRLGPGWSKPPRGWVVNPALGLGDCVNVRCLHVFVECDPSDSVFNGFRRSDGFYEGFCKDLLVGVFKDMPFLRQVSFDAYSSVKKSGAMMQTLLQITRDEGKVISWGPERGWTDQDEEVDPKSSHSAAKATALLNSVGLNVLVVG
jgi:hypothetical protein